MTELEIGKIRHPSTFLVHSRFLIGVFQRSMNHETVRVKI